MKPTQLHGCYICRMADRLEECIGPNNPAASQLYSNILHHEPEAHDILKNRAVVILIDTPDMPYMQIAIPDKSGRCHLDPEFVSLLTEPP